VQRKREREAGSAFGRESKDGSRSGLKGWGYVLHAGDGLDPVGSGGGDGGGHCEGWV
jgi:hypothetical protein